MPGPVIPKRPNPFMEALPEAVRGLVETFFPSDELPLDSIAPIMTAGSGAIRGLRSLLPMDEASRMGRAQEQGFTTPLYHGTRASDDFLEFQGPVSQTQASPHSGRLIVGDYGIHVSSRPETAARFTGETDYPHFISQGGRIMPLQVRMDRTLELPDMGLWHSPHHWVSRLIDPANVFQTGRSRFVSPRVAEVSGDPEMVQNLYDIAQESVSRRPRTPRGIDESLRFQQDITDHLTKSGYDSIRYKNTIEGVGEPSYALLDPRKIRSRFASFDPAKFGSRDIMAGLAGAGVAGSLASGRNK